MQVRSTMPRLGTRKLYHLLKPGLSQMNIKMGRDVFFVLFTLPKGYWSVLENAISGLPIRHTG